MKVMVVAQVENDMNVTHQVSQQIVRPNGTFFYMDPKPAQGIDNRRKRIAENHEVLRQAVIEAQPDLVWQIEGDCELPRDCLKRLLEDYEVLKGEDFGYVSGVQVGRHGLYCLGAWKNVTPTSFESLDYKSVGFQEVDATGFYCLLAPREVWLSGKAAWTDEPYGPDVVWGLSIDKKKYCDMQIEVGHIVYNKHGRRGIIKPSDMSTCNARFYLDKATNRWKYKQL